MDQAEPSWGSNGEGVKMGAVEAVSLASRVAGARLGVLTFEAEAVVTASPSMVDGGLAFHALEGLPQAAAAEASDQAF